MDKTSKRSHAVQYLGYRQSYQITTRRNFTTQ